MDGHVESTGNAVSFGDDSACDGLVAQYVQEALRQEYAGGANDLDFTKMPVGSQLVAAAPEDRVKILFAAFRALAAFFADIDEREHQHGGKLPFSVMWDLRDTRCRLSWLATVLLRKKLPLSANDLTALIRFPADGRPDRLHAWPLAGLIGSVEKLTKKDDMEEPLRAALKALFGTVTRSDDTDDRKFQSRLSALIGQDGESIALAPGPWAEIMIAALETMPAAERSGWANLFTHCGPVAAKGSPPEKWLAEGKGLVDAIGLAPFNGQLRDWLEAFEFNPDPKFQDGNGKLIKTLIWLAADRADEGMAEPLGRFAEQALHKTKGFGPPSQMLGKAAVAGLEQMPGAAGAAELARFRRRVKFPNIARMLEESLSRIAEREGVSLDAMEEQVLPDFGLGPDGRATETLGDVTAEIALSETLEVTLSWIGADGKPRKSVPAPVKAGHADALKELKARVKDIRERLSVERARLESLYLGERDWPLAEWRGIHLGHPLLAPLARRLIWRVEEGGNSTAFLPHGDDLIGVGGVTLKDFGDAARVSLWHPLGAAADEVRAWRERLAALEITQPFKQAHREIYAITPAELETENYSNRFAAHILRQHQFRRLAQSRGWKYDLQGAFDSHNIPERALHDRGIGVEFLVEGVNQDAQDANGFYDYVSTDRVLFSDRQGNRLDLVEMPPILFSELMRDVDLFVGVASVGNDPEWRDGGPEGPFAGYWIDYSNANLEEQAKTRRAVLEELLPKLAIADRCALEDRFLLVRGTRTTYRIHLGSSNIRMEPNDKYLCIVPGPRIETPPRVRLPFEGDALLSVILSKAFMLAEDDRITDESILGQIGG